LCARSPAPFATSLVTTSWQNRTIIAHAKLANVVDPTGQQAGSLPAGTTGQVVREMFNNLVTSQSLDARDQRTDDGDRSCLRRRLDSHRACVNAALGASRAAVVTIDSFVRTKNQCPTRRRALDRCEPGLAQARWYRAGDETTAITIISPLVASIRLWLVTRLLNISRTTWRLCPRGAIRLAGLWESTTFASLACAMIVRFCQEVVTSRCGDGAGDRAHKVHEAAAEAVSSS